MENPEEAVAEQFGLDSDPNAKLNEGMQSLSVDVDWFDYYFTEYIDQKDIKESTKKHYERSFRDWSEFMQQYERHPTLPSEYHVEAFVDSCLTQMEGHAVRKKLNHVKIVYEWMQENPRFPHPTTYNPFVLIKNKRKADLKTEDADDYPKLTLLDLQSQVESIKHIGERALTVFQLKTGVRSTELSNIRFEEIHLTDSDVLAHYDGCAGQDHGPMGSHDQLDELTNAVYIPPEDKRDGNKREMPTIIPLNDETRRLLIDWLLIRPDNGDPHVFLTQKGKPMTRESLRHIWTKHWHPDYEFSEEAELRTISPHYARHWFSTWFRTQANLPEPWVQYLRGDKMGPDINSTRSAFHRYVHTYYEDVEEAYRENVFKLEL